MIELQGEIDKPIIRVRDVNSPLSIIDRKISRKLIKDVNYGK